jgi:hypothetical protein
MLHAIDTLYNAIDFSHNADGVGLFVSPNYQLLVQFPFPVVEKVLIGDNFEIRDLLYKVNMERPYYVLSLSEKAVRFFEGSINTLEEIKDKNFPKEYEEEYLYAAASRGVTGAGNTQVRNFEKDRSALEEIRYKDFYRYADESLKDYLVDKAPLFLLGAEKDIARFTQITVNRFHIIQPIAGNYEHFGNAALAALVWPLVLENMQFENEKDVKEFIEKIGEHHAVNGIQEVWKAAKEGRGLKLLVEKDYRKPGFLNNDETHLFLTPPKTIHRIVADAVDDIIEMVWEKNGQVVFTENDLLKDYQRIALITRY